MRAVVAVAILSGAWLAACSFDGGAGPAVGGDGGEADGPDPGPVDALADAPVFDANPFDATPVPPALFFPRLLPEDRGITVDGDVDVEEWAGIAEYVLDPRSAGLVVPIDEYLRRGHADSVSMKVRFAWQPDALYFAVESSDDVFRTDNGPRQQDDAAVFYLNLDGDTDGAPDLADYALVLRARSGRNDHELIDLGNPLLALTGTRSAARTMGEGFSIEARVPADATGASPAPTAFASIGLSVLRIDDDHLNNPGGNNADAEALYFWFVGPSTCEACCPGFADGKERPSCDTTVMTTAIYDQPL